MMMEEPRDKRDDMPMTEFIMRGANELNDNGVGLWTIVPEGRDDFGLEGEELIAFIRTYILELLRRGAKPVKDADDSVHYMQVETKYGNDPDAIAEGVITDWLAAGAKDPEWGDYWFALPHTYEQKRDS